MSVSEMEMRVDIVRKGVFSLSKELEVIQTCPKSLNLDNDN